MFFGSDNQGPVPEAVLEALRVANQGYATSYGADAITLDVASRIQTLFEAKNLVKKYSAQSWQVKSTPQQF